MTALLLGVGALLLAVLAGALLDPRRGHTNRANDLPSMDEIPLAAWPDCLQGRSVLQKP